MCTIFAGLSMILDRGACSFGVAMLCWLVLLTGCPGNERQEGRPAYVEVLSDFVFVGSGPYDPKLVTAHEMKELPLPSHFQVGYQYVFHLKSLRQDADVYKNLLTRLQSKNIKITSASADMDRYVGGPGFRISFQGTGFKGFIFNTLDGQILNNPTLVREWSLDDYILVLEEA
ncbi:MAG TPA: hypothetical protein VFZ22_14075 [Pyrinomonadaceae bacterium]|nr:hypothetical protein [Pyrinomonadaceae bacterium]